MSDDLSSPVLGRPVLAGKPRAMGGALDDMPSGGAGGKPGGQPRPPAGLGEASEFAFQEVAGDPVAAPVASVETGEIETGAEAHEEVGTEATESAVEFAEATPAQMASSGAEAGEESAFSDMRGLEGFVQPEAGEGEGAGEGGVLRDAGTAAEGGQQEFFPILAALVPTLVSSVGPMVAKAVAGRLSAKAKAAVSRVATLPRPAPRPGPAPAPGTGSVAALLPLLAKLLQGGLAKASETSGHEAGEEGGMVDESFVTEAAAAMEVILGTDDRVPILNTTDEPWRRYCALRITFPSGAIYRGTGFLIGPRVLATAGHCVYLHNQGGWARKVEVIPGCNGTKQPFGKVEATTFRSVGGWVKSKLPECDYGCIILPTGAFGGKNLGHFGVAAFDAQTLVAQPAVIAGYHGDKPFAELWGMADFIKTVSAKTIGYRIDTMGGCSGAPVYIKRGGVRYVVGIHNYGAASGNSATRITQPVYQRLLAWSKL